DEPVTFSLKLRIPGWCRAAQLSVNGESVDIASRLQQGYVRIERRWQPGERVELELAMPVERVYAHPNVRQDVGRVALKRSPLVYCLEDADQQAPLEHVILPQDAELSGKFEPEMLDGVYVLRGPAFVEDAADGGVALYRTQRLTRHETTITAIPYYAWDN